MERYISIIDEESLDRKVKKYKNLIIERFNTSFDGCNGNRNIGSSIVGFLMSCVIHEYKKLPGDIHETMFYPSLLGVDLTDVWMKLQRNLIANLENIEDYVLENKNHHDFNQDDDKSDCIMFYMQDYCSYMIEAILFNDGNVPFLKIDDETITFLCKMCIGEFLGQLDMIDSGKVNLSIGATKRINEIIDDNEKLEERISILEKINSDLKIELSKYRNKKEKITYIEDKGRVAALNKTIKEKDLLIENMSHKVEELSFVKDISLNKEIPESSENEIDFTDKYVFVGGCFNTVQNLKRMFPNSYFYDKENEVDKSTVTRCDSIVYLTNFISHPLYYKVKNMCDSVNQIHCSSDNIVKVLDEIAKHM